MKKTYIYCLSENEIPFYVGKTQNIDLRISNHKLTFGAFDYKILYKCSAKKADELERKTIGDFIKNGIKLKNKLIYDNENNHAFSYKFKTWDDYKYYKIIAIETGISVQEMITVALNEKYKTKIL